MKVLSVVHSRFCKLRNLHLNLHLHVLNALLLENESSFRLLLFSFIVFPLFAIRGKTSTLMHSPEKISSEICPYCFHNPEHRSPGQRSLKENCPSIVKRETGREEKKSKGFHSHRSTCLYIFFTIDATFGPYSIQCGKTQLLLSVFVSFT